MIGHARNLTIKAVAPGKTILFGEHAVNRGQQALAVSVGLYASCTLTVLPDADPEMLVLSAEGREQSVSRAAIFALDHQFDAFLANGEYQRIQELVAADFFAPAKYVLAALGEQLPGRLSLHFESEIPHAAGLGSSGAIFVTLSAALARLLYGDIEAHFKQIATWALRGDKVAHGGIASGLDTQTSLYGGAIRYTAKAQAEPIAHAPGLTLVIGNSGVFAATSTVNGRVRAWLEARPLRLHYFREIGYLSQRAELALRAGEWEELGLLLNMNQVLLEKIGVSCPELEALNDAALGAGALGAKLSGSGGGGIMIALLLQEQVSAVAEAIRAAGGIGLTVPVGVPGVILHEGA